MTLISDVDAADLDARVRRLEESVEDLGDALAATPPATPAKPAAPNPVFPTVDAWVTGWFGPTFARRLGAARWCATWWRHPEAVIRLEALWRTWEVLRLDPAFGMATWLREHFDPQRAVLFGDDGPFQACDGDAAHHPPPPLPVQPVPPGWTTGPVAGGPELRDHAAPPAKSEESSA